MFRSLSFTAQRPQVRIYPPAMNEEAALRFMLWVDAVGGYLVCLRDEVVLGQPAPGSELDVPIMGNLSRRHATLRRDGESYLVRPDHSVKINGREIVAPTLLADGDLLELGSSVLIRFRRPHRLSATARLEFLSNHHTLPTAHAVLLMADSCILGPQGYDHVVCRDWSHELVLYRAGNRLFCRSAGPVEIDGQRHAEGGALNSNSRVVGDDFSMSLERV